MPFHIRIQGKSVHFTRINCSPVLKPIHSVTVNVVTWRELVLAHAYLCCFDINQQVFSPVNDTSLAFKVQMPRLLQNKSPLQVFSLESMEMFVYDI